MTEQTPDGVAAAGSDGMADVAAMAEDPRTDAEALCLCSLLWSARRDAEAVTTALTGADFFAPVYGALFDLIAAQIVAGRPHDPASIAASLTEAGTGHGGDRLARALAGVTTAGGAPEALPHYALAVANAAYRRSFHAAAAALTQAAAELPQEQLFPHLLDVGRAQRAAVERLGSLRASLSGALMGES